MTRLRAPAGATVIGWDGRDAGGRAVLAGVYFIGRHGEREVRVAKLD